PLMNEGAGGVDVPKALFYAYGIIFISLLVYRSYRKLQFNRLNKPAGRVLLMQSSGAKTTDK
ncbi:MAG: hypothetical protein ACI4ET_04465, partial [Bilifractor sp.]